MKQIDRNMTTLWEEIERLCNQPVNDRTAVELNAYIGALRAMCMIRGDDKPVETSTYSQGSGTDDMPTFTPELDGDTEFERLLMTIPNDRAHMVRLTRIFTRHLESLRAVNVRAYNGIMNQIREVAER